MPKSIQSIIYEFTKELKGVLGNSLAKVILYGSYARGDYRSNSDVDISPVIKNEEHFNYWVETLPFYRNVRDEGVVLNG